MRVRLTAGDQLTVPAQQRVGPDRKPRPPGSRQRTAQRRQERTISARQLRPIGLPAEDCELVAQDENLQLIRTAWPPEQPDQREQVPHSEIRERPDQVSPPSTMTSTEPSQPYTGGEPWSSLRTLRSSSTRVGACSRVLRRAFRTNPRPCPETPSASAGNAAATALRRPARLGCTGHPAQECL
jgi:hypothetical protein